MPVVEYYNAELDHYFITASPAEAAQLDATVGGAFERTGFFFYAWIDPAAAPADASPVCRFYAGANVLINSHLLLRRRGGVPVRPRPLARHLASRAVRRVLRPGARRGRTLPANTLPVYRFFNNRRDANHRYTVDLSVRRAMVNRGWVAEGNGTTATVFCSPI